MMSNDQKEIDLLIKSQVDGIINSFGAHFLEKPLYYTLWNIFFLGVKMGRKLEKDELESNKIKELEEMAKYYGH